MYVGWGGYTQVLCHATHFLDHLEEFNAETLINKDKPSEHKAGWHPGPHGHALRGEILAHGYLTVLHEALG